MAKREEDREMREEIAAREGVSANAITINRWRPDTCGCELYQWFVDGEPGAVDYGAIGKVCPDHPDETARSDHGRGRQIWDAVRGENLRKNAAISGAAGILGEDPETLRGRVTWEFEDTRLADGDQRRLVVSIAGINTNERNQIQGVVDTRFGPDAVSVRAG